METKDHKAVGIFLIEHIAEKVEKPLQWALLWGCVEPDFNVLTYLKGSMHGEKLRGHNYENAYERISCFVHKLERTQKKMRDTFGMYGMFLKLKWHFLLGKLTHYVADAFTFLHNKEFSGDLTEHVRYEAELHNYLAATLKHDMYAWRQRSHQDELGMQIGQMHEQYLQDTHGYITDCCYILNALADVMEHFTGQDVEWMDEKVA